MFADVSLPQNQKDLKDLKDLCANRVCLRARSQMGMPPTLHLRITLSPLTASQLHCTAGSSRSFTAIRKHAGLCWGSRLRSGEVFVYVGRIHNLTDLKRVVMVNLFTRSEWQGGSDDLFSEDPRSLVDLLHTKLLRFRVECFAFFLTMVVLI